MFGTTISFSLSTVMARWIHHQLSNILFRLHIPIKLHNKIDTAKSHSLKLKFAALQRRTNDKEFIAESQPLFKES